MTVFASQAQAAGQLENIEIFSRHNDEQAILSFEQPVEYRVFRVENPDRLVVDISDTLLTSPVRLPAGYSGQLLKAVRAARYDAHTLRVVFDLVQAVDIVTQGWQKPESGKARLGITLRPQKGKAEALPAILPTPETAKREKEARRLWSRTRAAMPDIQVPATEMPVPQNGLAAHAAPPGLKDELFKVPPVPRQRAVKRIVKTLTVAIDAGHGGQDPGAEGQLGAREKDITYAISKQLKQALEATGRYKAFLTRSTDDFVLLRERVVRARKAKADLFISIHADSAPGGEARGASVYTLSETASDKEAAKLAASENRVDVLSGLDMEIDNKDVADILIDLVRRDTRNQSADFAEAIVASFKSGEVRLLPRPHRFAGFAVLKAPDIPSILIETGFISHPQEEKLLSSVSYRDRLSRAIVNGVDRYRSMREKSQ